MNDDELYMSRCLELAEQGTGQVAPNPLVGAVLVHEGRIIGEGYHRVFGGPHAEVNCIGSVQPADRSLISTSTMFVSLEPCSHFGKTPPCTDLILEHKIPRVIVAIRDPFEAVNGRGIDKLRQAGVEVESGILAAQAAKQNRRFLTFHQKQRPFIILKWAQTADGHISAEGGKRMSISGDATNRIVHQWRAEEAAILVGTNTAISDDPSLTTRLYPGKNPVRVVIDRKLSLPNTLKLFTESQDTIILNTLEEKDEAHLRYRKVDDMAPAYWMQALHSENIQSVIVEGGALILQAFLESGLWDECRVITNTNLHSEQGVAAPPLPLTRPVETIMVGSDRIDTYISTQ